MVIYRIDYGQKRTNEQITVPKHTNDGIKKYTKIE